MDTHYNSTDIYPMVHQAITANNIQGHKLLLCHLHIPYMYIHAYLYIVNIDSLSCQTHIITNIVISHQWCYPFGVSEITWC